MSLSCLTCKISRTDSTNELNDKKFNSNIDKNSKEEHKFTVERSWSGNLAPITRPDGNMTHSLSVIPENKVKKGPHRLHNSGPVELSTGIPKLVRSPGIRRDWSFEDLRRQIVR
ncbi:hypothetical protein BC332_15953 [Capsicum chinense]|nr:hypothetical protein FXO38_26686 [Capsicum annuum]KAF3663643.1 hypothetical protein FXO37_11888 [Capsicum annuum]PHU14748.1 hypothetical protein BC332_15953 [Capsicum chinense]